jgi:hypothetical protein
LDFDDALDLEEELAFLEVLDLDDELDFGDELAFREELAFDDELAFRDPLDPDDGLAFLAGRDFDDERGFEEELAFEGLDLDDELDFGEELAFLDGLDFDDPLDLDDEPAFLDALDFDDPLDLDDELAFRDEPADFDLAERPRAALAWRSKRSVRSGRPLCSSTTSSSSSSSASTSPEPLSATVPTLSCAAASGSLAPRFSFCVSVQIRTVRWTPLMPCVALATSGFASRSSGFARNASAPRFATGAAAAATAAPTASRVARERAPRPRCFFESAPLALSSVSRSAADSVSRSVSLTAVAMCLPTSHLVVAREGVTPGGSSKKPLGHHAVGPDLLRNSIRDRLRRAVAADGRTRSPERRDPAGF